MNLSKRILVVDDFPSIKSFVCQLLSKRGYETTGVSNGNEAYQFLLENKGNVKLVLTDYHMPECSGFELLKKIKENPDTSNVHVVFLTTESDHDLMRNAKDLGLTDWIKKPYRAEQFYAKIDSLMSDDENEN